MMERAAVGVILVAVAFAFAVYTNRQDERVDRTVDAHAEAVVFICSTTKVLDDLVVQAANQIESSLDNGTYARLLREGVITKENVKRARGVLAKYRAAHLRLRLPNACVGQADVAP